MAIRPIDANALRKRIEEWMQELEQGFTVEYAYMGYALDDVLDYIDTAPTVAGKAKWIPTVNPRWPAYSHDKCSACGWTNTKNSQIGVGRKATKFKFCPCCGAIMEDDNG